jgi:hypothetical protein
VRQRFDHVRLTATHLRLKSQNSESPSRTRVAQIQGVEHVESQRVSVLRIIWSLESQSSESLRTRYATQTGTQIATQERTAQ